MSVNGTLAEDKMRRFKGECEHFSFNKCPVYTHDSASAKFNTNSQEADNSACLPAHAHCGSKMQSLVEFMESMVVYSSFKNNSFSINIDACTVFFF